MTKTKTYGLVVTALFAALMCIFGPMSLPIGPVPISLTTLVIYIAVFLLGPKLGTLSVAVYLLLGLVGLPVFSGYSGGVAKLAGPTGGYLIGYLPMAAIIGVVLVKWSYKWLPAAIGMVVGTLLLYIIGTAWFVISMKCELWYALTICVFPFLLGDAAKIAVSIVLGINVRKGLKKAGFVE